jgi:hypothetical protein
MSSNGPPPNKSPDFERIKTKLTEAIMTIERMGQVSNKTTDIIAKATESLCYLKKQTQSRLYPTSPPPPIKKHHHNRKKLPKFTDNLDFITGMVVGDLLDETP